MFRSGPIPLARHPSGEASLGTVSRSRTSTPPQRRDAAHSKGHLKALLATLAFAALAAPSAARAAAPDNNVEWAGVSHVAWQDRRPLCPVSGETFAVRFQTWKNDLTAARVGVTTVGTAWVDAAKIGARGPYDIWQAQVPSTAGATESYVIELTDGSDTDYLSVGGVTDLAPVDGGFALNFTTLTHAPVGATPVTGGGAVFKVWAPTRVSCYVRGEFNAWGLANPLTKQGEYFIGRVNGVADRAQYKYFFNNSVWNTDPRARSLESPGGYNARVENPFRYVWRVSDFATPALEELVIYQLHVGTFAGRNDPVPGAAFPSRYLDVAARVGHLAQLGINAVMLNPVTEFPGDESAGYNPITSWTPEWKYGTPDHFKAMVDSLHAHGIAVLLDIVWNHLSPTDNFLWNYDGSQQWFDSPTAVNTPWGSQADFDKTVIKDYFANSALYWMEEMGVDGFRMDATDYMNIAPQEAAGWSLMQRFNDEMDNRWADKIAIAEQLPNDDWVTRPTSLGGAGFDAQYYDAFTDNLRQEILDAAFGDPEMFKISSIINGSGTYLSGRRVVNYYELHDEAWPSSGGQRFVKSIDGAAPHDDAYARGRSKLAQGLVMFAPGVPAFLQGTEWLEDTDFGANSANRIDWSKRITYAPQLEWFRKIVSLRRWPAFRADAARHVFHVNEGANVIAFRRTDTAGNPMVVIANFSNTDFSGYRLGVPLAGNWFEMVNSQSAVYGGNGLDNPGPRPTDAIPADGFVQSLSLTIPQMGLLVLGPGTVVDVGEGEVAGAALRFGSIWPLPARSGLNLEYVTPRPGQVRIDLYDASGRRVRTLAEGWRTAGAHRERWDGRNSEGAAAAPGVYFVRLAMEGERAAVRRIPVLR